MLLVTNNDDESNKREGKKGKWKCSFYERQNEKRSLFPMVCLSGEEECIEWICWYRVQCLKVKTTKETLVKQSWKHLKRIHYEIRGTFNGSHHSRMAETVHKLRGKLPWIFSFFWITSDICQSRSFYRKRMIGNSTVELSMPVMRLCLLTNTTCL